MPGAVHDIITHANFGRDRLRDFGMAMGLILAFFIASFRRLYNTLALPCECVITTSEKRRRTQNFNGGYVWVGGVGK